MGEDLEAALRIATQTRVVPTTHLGGVDKRNSVCEARAIYQVASLFNRSYSPGLYTEVEWYVHFH